MLRQKPVRPALWATLGGTLYVAALPPFGLWWLMPIAIALLAASGLRRFTSWALVGALVSLSLYSWLISVTLWGWLALFVVMGLLWCVPLWYWQRSPRRLLVASLWVTLEGVRAQMGFGWLPVAVSATGNRVLLGWAGIGGEALLSFILVFVGLTLAKIFRTGEALQKINLARQFFIIVLVLAAVGTALNVSFPRAHLSFVKIGLVQPDAPVDTTAKPDYYREMEDLRVWTNVIKNDDAQVIFWPEQVTPWPANADERMRAWLEDGSTYLQTPIVCGALWQEDAAYYNAAAVIDPRTGLDPHAYKKRRLVPFGEYIPFASLGWIRSWTPIADSFAAGDAAVVLNVRLAQGTLKLWPLICYEDTFDYLAWGAARRADAMVVFLNDSWFGYGAAAQHAAHSVLRSVEQGIPVIRVANSGLSGWVLPNGQTRYLEQDGDAQKAQSQVLELPLVRRYTFYSLSAPLWRLGFLLTCIVGFGIFLWRKPQNSQR